MINHYRLICADILAAPTFAAWLATQPLDKVTGGMSRLLTNL